MQAKGRIKPLKKADQFPEWVYHWSVVLIRIKVFYAKTASKPDWSKKLLLDTPLQAQNVWSLWEIKEEIFRKTIFGIHCQVKKSAACLQSLAYQGRQCCMITRHIPIPRVGMQWCERLNYIFHLEGKSMQGFLPHLHENCTSSGILTPLGINLI